MDAEALAREYYRAIDEDDYGALTRTLAGDFVHRRPDRRIEGREAFVTFMRSERPERDTEHVLEAVYLTDAADRVAVEGRLRRADGTEWFRFVDVFEVGERLRSLRTYTDG